MINVPHDHATVNVLTVEKCKNIFLMSKVSHIKSNLFNVYVSVCTHPTDGNLTVSCSVFLLFWVLTEQR